MSTKISWTNETWNPVVGCTKVSAGCKFCYAETMAGRLSWMEHHDGERGDKYLSVTKFTQPVMLKEKQQRMWNGKTFCDESALDKPLHWKKPRMIFVCSMGDLFHESVPFEFIDKVIEVAEVTPWHTYQVLTKRPERMLEYFKWRWRNADQHTLDCAKAKQWKKEHGVDDNAMYVPNIWAGVTAENQEQYEERWAIAQQIPAAKLFISFEPLLSGIKMYHINDKLPDWAIIGCESGHNRRECKTEWVRDLVGQCQSAGVATFVKQLQMIGCRKCGFDPCTHLHGHKRKTFVVKTIEDFPKDLQIREYPQ